jgi:hypothetical protein
MAIELPATPARNLLIDKEALLQAVDERNARIGFVPDETATLEKVREMMRADGVRAEDNVFSRDIIRERHEDEDEA